MKKSLMKKVVSALEKAEGAFNKAAASCMSTTEKLAEGGSKSTQDSAFERAMNAKPATPAGKKGLMYPHEDSSND
ncbi:hypothetical protein [Thioalkalivibrio sp. ALE19]|uniref:hypothetical protein n=1 Tax=Thioalkalivibrio sp. ALE19 TaxID=1266909 RepID=UPI0012DE4549|nr:hypothetical protein [Thioalkalivibrio sp. ALE19]